MKVIFSERAYASVLAETTEKIKTETGGLFLGTVVDDVWYIIESIDPGPKSVFEVAYFEYDQKYTQHLINKIANLYETKLSLVGLWHRHPGSFDVFSSTDDGTNCKYASMRKNGAISALVNVDPKFRITMYHVEYPHKYTKIPFEVGNVHIPQSFMKFKSPDAFERLMNGMLHPKKEAEYTKSLSLASFMDKIVSITEFDKRLDNDITRVDDITDEMLNRLIESTINDISFMTDTMGIKMSILQKEGTLVMYQEGFDKIDKVCIGFRNMRDLYFEYKCECYCYEDGMFEKQIRSACESQVKGEHVVEPLGIVAMILKLFGIE